MARPGSGVARPGSGVARPGNGVARDLLGRPGGLFPKELLEEIRGLRTEEKTKD